MSLFPASGFQHLQPVSIKDPLLTARLCRRNYVPTLQIQSKAQREAVTDKEHTSGVALSTDSDAPLPGSESSPST
jgi:hypothetical protein